MKIRSTVKGRVFLCVGGPRMYGYERGCLGRYLSFGIVTVGWTNKITVGDAILAAHGLGIERDA